MDKPSDWIQEPAAARVPLKTPVELEHVCGLQGFGGLGDECPACTAWAKERNAPHAATCLPAAQVSLEDRLHALRRVMCGVGVVGSVDGHDVIRRDSVIELIDREIRAASQEGSSQENKSWNGIQ